MFRSWRHRTAQAVTRGHPAPMATRRVVTTPPAWALIGQIECDVITCTPWRQTMTSIYRLLAVGRRHLHWDRGDGVVLAITMKSCVTGAMLATNRVRALWPRLLCLAPPRRTQGQGQLAVSHRLNTPTSVVSWPIFCVPYVWLQLPLLKWLLC